MAPKIRKGDEVHVIAGKDVGATGRVLEVMPSRGRVVVEGINRITRHEKISMNQRGGQQGGISHREAPIDLSNVALSCPNDGATRAGFKFNEDGTKIRICKKCGTEI